MSFTPETLLRQWQTLRLIPRHPRMATASDLCNKLAESGFTIGKRTVERDLQSLARIFPLLSDERSKPYGWSWQKNAPTFDLPGLSTSQAVTILLAREHLRTLLPVSVLVHLQDYFKLAEQTLSALRGHVGLATWLDKVRTIPSTQPLLSPKIDEAVQAGVHESLLAEKQCKISYQGKEKTEAESYSIHPLGLVQRGQVLYLVCSIKTYQDIRLLAMHRIQQAEMLESPAIAPTGFNLDAYLCTGALGWFPQDTIQLDALFTAEAAVHLAETPLAEGQSLQVSTDGRVRLTATVRETLQLRWWLQGFGEAVEVLAPLELRQRILESAKELVRRYEDGNPQGLPLR